MTKHSYLSTLLFLFGTMLLQAQTDVHKLTINLNKPLPTTFTSGQTYTFEFVIGNWGTQAVTGYRIEMFARMSFFEGARFTLDAYNTTETINAGTSKIVTVTRTIPANMTSGTYEWGFTPYPSDGLGTISDFYQTFTLIGTTARPDFTITAITAPSSVVTGNTFQMDIVIKNQGAAAGNFTATELKNLGSYYFSEIGVRSFFLAPNESKTLSVNCVPNGTTLTGNINYQVEIFSDIDVNQSNNTFSKSIQLLPTTTTLPDLSVVSATYNTPFYAGKYIQANITVKNNSNIQIDNAFSVAVYQSDNATLDASDKIVAENIFYSIAPLQELSTLTATPSVVISDAPGKSYYYFAVVDYLNEINESNEGNNNIVQLIPIESPPLPDLTIAIIKAVSSLNIGDNVSTTSDLITLEFKNLNEAPPTTGYPTLSLLLSKDNIRSADDTKLVLNNNGSTDFTVYSTSTYTLNIGKITIPNTFSSGTNYLIAVADYPNAIPETNENNNIAIQAVTLVNAPKIVIKNVTGSTSVKVGTSLTLNVTIKNEGSAAGSDSLFIYQALRQTCFKGPCSINAIRLTKGFQTPTLNPNEERTIAVTFAIPETFVKGIIGTATQVSQQVSNAETFVGTSTGRIEFYDIKVNLFLYDITPIYNSADIQLTASSTQTTYNPADGKMKVKVTVKNNGTETARYINIIPSLFNVPSSNFTQYLPTGTNATKGNFSTLFLYGTYSTFWYIETLAVNESASIDFEFTILPLNATEPFPQSDLMEFAASYTAKVVDNNTSNDITKWTFVKSTGGGGSTSGVLSIVADPATYKQYTFEKISVTYKPTAAASGVTVGVTYPSGDVVLASETAYKATTSQGTFDGKTWNVGAVNANQTYTLTFYLFTLVKDKTINITATQGTNTQTLQLLPFSTGGGTTQADLTLASLVASQTSVAQGSVLNFTFDLKNIGNATASGNFNIKSYLSKDQTLSTDDYFDGTVPTGNVATGQTIAAIKGAMTVNTSLAVGNYYLILKVDANNQIAESNENNNTIATSNTIAVTTSGGGTSTQQLTLSATPSTYKQWDFFKVTVTVKNTSTVSKSYTHELQLANSTDAVRATEFAPTATQGSVNVEKWTIGTLAAGASATYTLVYFAKTSGKNIDIYGILKESNIEIARQTLSVAPTSRNLIAENDGKSVFIQNAFPSPASDVLNLNIFSPSDIQSHLNIYDLQGKTLQNQSIMLQKGNNDLNLDIHQLNSGLYLLNLIHENGKIQTLKFLKQQE